MYFDALSVSNLSNFINPILNNLNKSFAVQRIFDVTVVILLITEYKEGQ